MWHNPSLQQLLFLEAVLEEGNLVRAASRLHTTHSTISRGLKALSNELGIEFFDKTPRGLKPNDVGIIYGSEIRTVLELAKRAFDLAQYRTQKDRLPFRVGHSPYIHGQLIPLLTKLALAGTAAPPIVLKSGHTMQLVRYVLNCRLEAGFGILPIIDKDLRVERVAHEPFAVCLTEHHLLSKQPKLSARQLRDEAVILIPRRLHPHFYDHIVGYLRTLEFASHRFYEAHTITQALDFAALGAGAAFVPRSAQRFSRAGVVFKPLTDELMRIETAVFIRRNQMNETVKDFIAIAIAGVQTLNINPVSP